QLYHPGRTLWFSGVRAPAPAAGPLGPCGPPRPRQRAAPPAEVIVVSAAPPPGPPGLEPRWIEMADSNPARRRNVAAREARGAVLAFLDDDAEAEPEWLAPRAPAPVTTGAAGGRRLAHPPGVVQG